MNRSLRLGVAWFAVACALAFAGPSPAIAQQAELLFRDAANFQNAKEYAHAIEQWTRFLDQHPRHALAVRAQHYLGVCCMQLQPPDFARAGAAFEAVLRAMEADPPPLHPQLEETYLNLGFVHYVQGKASRSFDKASATFEALLKKFPAGAKRGEACFYLGEAYYHAGRKEAAARAYLQYFDESPQGSLRRDALYAAGVTLEELGRAAEAESFYDKYLAEFPQSPLTGEVQLRKAEAMLQTAIAAEGAQNRDLAAARFAAAEIRFGLAAQGTDPALAALAASRRAICQQRVAFYARPATPAAPRGDQYAFLVSVREYDKTELTNLRFSENDIRDLATTLREKGFLPENVVELSQTKGATQARYLPLAKNIRTEFRLLLQTLRPEDTVVVAFAGHGVQFHGEEGAYFCPMDARLVDRTTLVSLREIYDALKASPAQAKVLLVDACRNDPRAGLARSAAGVELEAVGRPQRVAPPPGIVALFSCAPGQQAFEDPALQHGVFFHYVIEGLRGAADVDADRAITLDELKLFAVKRVQTRVRVELGQLQTPESVGQHAGVMTIVRAAATP